MRRVSILCLTEYSTSLPINTRMKFGGEGVATPYHPVATALAAAQNLTQLFTKCSEGNRLNFRSSDTNLKVETLAVIVEQNYGMSLA